MPTTFESSFKISPFEAKTLSWWRSRKDKIDMDPPYQRKSRLWSDTDKAYLIDSILNGFDVPKFYVADFTWGDSKLNRRKLPYAIIDGKQRLEAIFDFFSGRISLNRDFIYKANPELDIAGYGYRELQNRYPTIAEDFENFNIHVMGVTAQSDAPINELFIRLNRSKSLNGAELRNAMTGKVADSIRHIAAHDFFLRNILFNTTRMQDRNVAAKLLLCEYRNKLVETKKKNLDSFVRDSHSTATDTDAVELAARRVIAILDDMADIFLPSDRLLSSVGIIPVYYWFVKSTTSKRHHLIRGFLEDFEIAKRNIKTPSSQNSIIPNPIKFHTPDLLEYELYNRSTNDQSSHEKRLVILQKYFSKY